MEPTPSTTVAKHETKKRSTPWGLFIGLLLILGVIVWGAYYTFNERYVPKTQNVR